MAEPEKSPKQKAPKAKRPRRSDQVASGGLPARDLRRRLARLERQVDEQARLGEELLRRAELAADVIRGAERSWDATPGALVGAETADGLSRAMQLRRANVLPVREPLVLICQAQRSGGTLLARLFDAHPQCHAHPHELHIGARRPHTWPALPLDEDPDAWFAKLREERLGRLFEKGKRSVPLKALEKSGETLYPFMLPPAFQRLLFLDEVERRAPIESEREVLDSYMTSLFNGWIDNQNLFGVEKRWVVAFSPRRAWGDGLERFFSIYPEGRLISILRDPLSWYTSALGRDPEAPPEALLELWKRSAREMLEANRIHAESFRVVRFDELVLDTPGVMRGLAEWLDIDYDERLTAPTFNCYPVGPNSSYDTNATGVVKEPVERYKRLLSPEQEKMIRGECDELYSETLALTGDAPKA